MTTVEINGLKDMIACNTRISSIIDDHLSYSGYDISSLPSWGLQCGRRGKIHGGNLSAKY